MKSFSFSISSNTSSSSRRTTVRPSDHFNSNDNNPSVPHKQFVTEFDPSKSLNPDPQTLIIPPKQNEWRPHKKLKNIDDPIQLASNPNETLTFQPDPHAQDPPSDVTYGLNVRKKDGGNGGEVGDDRVVYEPIERVMIKKLKEDLEKLPEDRGFEEFDDVPVEGFGAALLKGYGWYEGRGIGRKHKKDVKIVEFDRRAGKEGLGFVAAPLVSNVDNGKDGGRKKKDKILEGFYVGKDVRIVGGSEMGLKGRIMEVKGSGDYVVKVFDGREEVDLRVRGKYVADLGSLEEERCLKKLRQLQIDSKKKDKRRSRDEREEERVRWLVSNIRVRIVSRELKRGRFYLKKGKVVDVVGPTTCDIVMDDSGELIQGVEQELLETAIPRSGGLVLVLYGQHKGAFGSLLEKNTEKETAVIQDADTRKPLHVRLAQIAEYTGDPSDIGY